MAQRYASEEDWIRRYTEAGHELDPLLQVYLPPEAEPSPEVSAGWGITERLIRETVAMADDLGARYVALVVPFEAAVRESSWSSFKGHRTAGKEMVRRHPEQRLGALFEYLGVDWIAVLDPFSQAAEEVLPYRDGHFNPAGHAITAELLFQQLSRY
ncbi:MAG: hypothetical protein R3200_07250 [Xanthomonadales bacterium]|nr:hypothetical protein [Xanthomonadales bacterium]